MDNTIFCEWCEEEKNEEGNMLYSSGTADMLCDDCYVGAKECACHKAWTHEDIGCVNDRDYIDDKGQYHCNDCAQSEVTCSDCGEEVGKDNLRTYHTRGDANKRGFREHLYYELCEECYEERMPSIDPEEIAKSMTDDEGQQQEIIEAIENNMETNGTIWKQLKDATTEERWQIIEIMGVARSRHEDTDYDAMLASGISRDNAREYIKQS